MSRACSSLRPPSADLDLSGFPVHRHRDRAQRWRAHGEHSPWYFSSAEGRFNLSQPRGTLNTASSADVATREYLGHVLVGDREIPASLISGRRVSELELPDVDAADFTSGEAIAFGIAPGDVAGPVPDRYTTTRAWAEALADAGFGGIRSRSRFAGGDTPTCLYVFGDSGEHVRGEITHTQSMWETLEGMAGFVVVPTPSSEDLLLDDS